MGRRFLLILHMCTSLIWQLSLHSSNVVSWICLPMRIQKKKCSIFHSFGSAERERQFTVLSWVDFGGFWAFWLLPTWIRSISLEACFRLCMWPHLKDTYVSFYREEKWEMIVLAVPIVALNSKFRNYGTVNQWYQDKLLRTLLVIFRQTTSFSYLLKVLHILWFFSQHLHFSHNLFNFLELWYSQ